MKQAIVLTIFVFVIGCTTTENITHYSVTLLCKSNDKIKPRVIESTAVLTKDDILKLIPTVEDKFGYKPNSCKQI